MDNQVSAAGDLLESSLVPDAIEDEPKNHFTPTRVQFPVNAPHFHQPVVEEGIVVGEAEEQEVSADNMPDPAPPAVDYDAENKIDGEKANDLARTIKIEFDPTDINFWFSQLEGEMLMANVNSQWLKKTVLQRNLPNKQKEDVKAYLTLPRGEAGNHIYLDVKTELVRIYAPKPQDSYQRALSRTMTGLPSQLGNQIITDICSKHPKLTGCCCAKAALALWTLQLPVNVRAHVSQREFNVNTYKQVFEDADKVFLSAKQVSIAAMTAASSGPSLDETLPAFSPQNQPAQVAAFNKNASGSGKGGKNNKNKKNKDQGQGQGQSSGTGDNKGRGKRHSSNPPDSVCSRHYRHGPESWFCVAPTTCPWKDKVTSRP